MIGVIYAELNVDGFCNPNYDTAQNSGLIGSTRIISNENPLQVIKESSHFLILRFQLPKLKIQKQLQNGNSATHIGFDGAVWTTETGKPKLPVYTVQIGMPSSSSVTATVLQKQSSFKSVELPLITNQIIDPFFPDAQEWNDSAKPPGSKTSNLYPAETIKVVPVGFVRSQRVGALHIHPVQYNSTTQQIKITHDITFRIDFYGAPIDTAVPLSTHFLDSTAYENLYQTMLINNTQASSWRRRGDGTSRMQIQAAPAAPASNRRRFKTPITETTMYRITYNRLSSSGITPETIDLNSIRIETSGREQGFYIFDENQNETFDQEDMIVFYARAISNKFTDTNFYWFSFVPKGTENAAGEPEVGNTFRIGTRSGAPVTRDITPPDAFFTKLRFEENRLHDPLDGRNVKSELADHYFWTGFRGGNSGISTKKFSVELPGAVPRDINFERDAILRVKLQGASRKNAAKHKAVFYFNTNDDSKQLGREEEWLRQESVLIARNIPQNRIHDDEPNELRIDARDENDSPGGSYDFYLDWYEFEYWHNFRAKNNRLEFNSETEPEVSGKTHFKVSNFQTETIDVYKLNSSGLAAKLIDGKVTGGGNSYQILFEDDVTQYTNYFVIANHDYRIVNVLTEVPPSDLRNSTTQADYIVVTHKTFIESVQPLADFRRSQGLTVKVVDIDEIYDEFSGGIFNPFAIRTFLRIAYQTWQSPAPTYVLLVGDAHYDYKQVTKQLYATYDLYPNFVPTYHGWAPESGETAMDQRFVNIVGDDALPDMLIGRLSVQTPQELTGIIQKIIDYEENPKIGPWQATLVQVADDELNNPSDETFETSRDKLIQQIIPVGYNTKQIYLRKIRIQEEYEKKYVAETKKRILRAFSDGALVIEYAGHGGIHTWADEGIFHVDDATDLRNRYLPFVVATTCLNGKFDKPQQFGSHSLSEQLLLGKYGAIASLSASRLTYATANAQFDEDLFTTMFVREPFEAKQGQFEIKASQPSIGKIVTDAKIRFITRSNNSQWVPGTEQYILFGDPATRLALPTLDIQVELEDIALNSNKQITITNNEVGTYDTNRTWWKAENFSPEKLIASAIFQNHFDDDLQNDFTERSTQGRVWQGEYGRIQLKIPSNALPGRGFVRMFAYDAKRSALGGATFWVDTPIIADIREDLDAIETHALNVQVLVIDDLGADKGIRSIYVDWNDTINYKNHTTPMVKTEPPPGSELPEDGQWYHLQTPILLPLGGGKIRYRIYVTDSSGIEVVYPSANKRNEVDVPEGPNIAIATDGTSTAPIRYTFDKNTGKYILIAELINDGGRTVKTDIEVVFSEGNPDVGGDLQIDEGAEILGSITLNPDDWQEGDTVLQRTVVTLKLEENLATGVHKIYVLVDPEIDTTTDDIKGNIAEPSEFDNMLNITFIVNEFFYEPPQPLEAFSLDRVFDFEIPASAATVQGVRIPLTISSNAPFGLTQPSLRFASIPRVAALRRGLLRTGEERSQQYEVSFRASDVTLIKPATLKLRFDVSGLEDIVRENTPWQENSKDFRAALIEEAEKLGIYAWHPSYEKWKRLPSQVSYTTGTEKPKPEDDKPIFQLENYVTPIQTENANRQPFPIENIKISPELTPAGIWVILFLDPTQYAVYLKRKHLPTFEKFDNPGQLDIPFREENYGIEFTIPKNWVVPPELDDDTPIVPFEFADILIFETDYSEGKAFLKGTRNQNIGNGTATVKAGTDPDQEFTEGEWFIFFLSSDFYELRDKTGEPLFFSNEEPVREKVNKTLFVSHLGFEILVTTGSEPFQFGDKIKFSSAQVGTITAQTTELTPFTLISSDDAKPPTFNLWVDGVQPQTGSVIAPRPHISILLEDTDGVNLDTLIIRRGDNGKPLKPISDYTLRNPKDVNTVPIDYKPILFPGEYAFEIEARDFNGNAIGGEAEKIQTRFIVIEMPDVTSPVVEILVNDEILVGEVSDANSLGELKNIGKNRITQQPHCEIRVTDETALDGSLLNITFNQIDVSDATQRYREFDMATWEFDVESPETANFSFAPDLPNGTYRLQVTATDTSENTTDLEAVFTLDESVTLTEVFNVPNPVENGKTFFTYQLAQPPDKVTIKIYTVSGRLIRTITEASANRGNNETYWDGKDETGIRCANGVYLYRVIAHIENGTVEKIGKLAILR